MAATPSLKVVKSITYRGVSRHWSNRYHFNGGTPADSAHWTTFSDAVVTAEKACMFTITGNQIVQTLGYAAGSDVPVFTKTYATAGTMSPGTNQIEAGDVCGLVRYSTSARTPKNHPIYLFNYYHAVMAVSQTLPDDWFASQRTAYATYGGQWISGFSDGTNTLVRAGPNGATATGVIAEQFLTHRDFPRG
jgi:hypothetical protein